MVMSTVVSQNDGKRGATENSILVVTNSDDSAEAALEEGLEILSSESPIMSRDERDEAPSIQVPSKPLDDDREQLPLNSANSLNTSISSTKTEGGDSSEWQLVENVYSIMYTSRAGSPAFLFAVFVFLFQMTIIGLLLFDLLDHFERSKNPFNVPPGVSPTVKAAQVLALLLAVATQEDVINAVVMLQRGYDDRVLILSEFATKQKWCCSCILQLLAGSGYLMTIFILVVQSDSVIGMMLNFAALSFVAQIDDVAFSLASKGFLSSALENEAHLVEELRLLSRHSSKTLRCVLFFSIYTGLMAGYTVIVRQQEEGKFLCQKLQLQFGDGFAPEAATFSGVYDQTDFLINGKVTYIERRSGKAMLGYCKELNAWTLTSWEDFYPPEDKENPCRWYYKSPQTDTFDITATSDSTWVINVDNVGAVDPFQTFLLECVDCDNASGTCGARGHCNNNNECVCDEGWYGIHCRSPEPCPHIAVDARTNLFSSSVDERTRLFPSLLSNVTFSDEYFLLTDGDGFAVTTYEKPVYAFYHGSSWSLIIFMGRRWIVTNTAIFYQFGVDSPIPAVNATRSELSVFLKDLHGFFTPIPGYFVSDPMDVGTPSDVLSPVGLRWYHTMINSLEGVLTRMIDHSHPLDTVLFCTVCHPYNNVCFFDSECVDGACNCTQGYEGSLCEVKVDNSNA